MYTYVPFPVYPPPPHNRIVLYMRPQVPTPKSVSIADTPCLCSVPIPTTQHTVLYNIKS